MNKKGVLIASGDVSDLGVLRQNAEGALIFCCDGGLRHAVSAGLTPDLILGDFDSADPAQVDFFRQKGVPAETFPTHKDETDAELGLRRLLEIGVTEIEIFGALGGRPDHALANLQLLLLPLRAGVPAWIIDGQTRIALTDSHLSWEAEKGTTVSLLPVFPAAKGVTTEGLAYPLRDEPLFFGRTRGVSNVMTENRASVSLTKGLLYVILSNGG